jgi:predicted amidohydrolase YtcJ
VAGPEVAPVDAVLVGGEIWTMAEPARATAVAIRGDKIAAVGGDAEIRALAGPATRVIELRGRAVTPGLIDSHAHLYGLGTALESVDLRGVESAEAAARRVAEAAKTTPEGDWITGRGWDQNLWASKSFPSRKILDAAVGDRPVALRRVDGHALWASSKALELAGITRATRSPDGGVIARDAAGEATGVFVDNAMSLVEDKIPAPSEAAVRRRILRASAAASAAGLTGVHEMGISARVADIYADLAGRGELPLRIYAFLSGPGAARGRSPQLDRDGADRFAVRAVKLFADGALGSRGARLAAPYSDAPDTRGLWVTEPAALGAAIAELAGAGWQVGVHAIGDAANRAALDGFEKASDNPASLRLRVEHAQILAPSDLPRLAGLGVIASMQPTHATSDMPWAAERVGPERIRGAYAWRSLLESGARICAGSDFPVEKVSPLLGIWAATTRRSEAGEPAGGWLPDQRMTLEEAIAAFTREGAYASFSESERGAIAPGMLADLTVYDRGLSIGELRQTQIDMTVVGGRIVFERD